MDARIENIMIEQRLNDKSFQGRGNALSTLLGLSKYSQHEAREIWFRGIRYGIEIGLYKAGLEGQIIELTQNTTNAKHKEFLEKLYQLTGEYKCAIQYHPQAGMVVIDRTNDYI